MNTDIKLGIYKHSKKGTEYRVVCLAKHSETLEDMVVYEALYNNELSRFWVRPAHMWSELVVVDGVEVPRFVFLRSE